MGSTSSGSRVWQQGVWKGVVDSGLEDIVVLEVKHSVCGRVRNLTIMYMMYPVQTNDL